jgi:hypothetical protein
MSQDPSAAMMAFYVLMLISAFIVFLERSEETIIHSKAESGIVSYRIEEEKTEVSASECHPHPCSQQQ